MAIKANFSAYSSYVVDSLHQWDLNQVLTVEGLNLATVPEVHFSNKNMDRAIVRQATMTDHVVRVNIPNSLLQDPLRIYAHIGIYEGSTYKVVETVEIPVKPRTRPCDYQIADTDDEVYSFKALANKLANAATKDQLANIVAGVSSDSELVDVRYGIDGVTYSSAGEAVRKQGQAARDGFALAGLYNRTKYTLDGGDGDVIVAGQFCIYTDGSTASTEAWYTTDYIRVKGALVVRGYLVGVTTVLSVAFYDKNKAFLSGVSPTTDYGSVSGEIDVPEVAEYVRFCFVQGMAEQFAIVEKITMQNELQGKIVTATGDSVTAATASAPDGNYVKLIAERNSMAYENKAVWGAVFAKGVTIDGAVLPSMLDTIDTMRSDADYVILSGGINDFCYINSGDEPLGEVSDGYGGNFNETTFCGAVEKMLYTALLKWPGKKILFVIEHKMASPNSVIGQEIEAIYLPLLLQMLHKWGVPYVDMYHDAPPLGLIPELRDVYTWDADGDGVSDGWHPTREGYDLFYVPRVEARLRSL